ncbi:MAG TPA: hypothetical protein VD948_12445 [Rhodothermales bacterium]|nr:hypothetical protein [Rhodothermales bacterium]
MRFSSLSAFVAGLLVLPVAQAQFSVDPVIATLSAPAGGVATEVRVHNTSAEPARFTFYFGDFDQTETGENLYAPLGTNPHSCGDRVSVFPNGATLAPGQRQTLQVRMAPGAETCWSMLFVETRVAHPNGVSVGQRIGVKVYGVPPGADTAGEVASVEAASEGDSVRVSMAFRNLGTSPLRPAGRIEIRTPEGTTLTALPVDAFSVLPGYLRRGTFYVAAALPAGRYVAIPILDFGADYLTAGQAAFEKR